MQKEFEAYYSKAYAWIFAVIVSLFLFGIIMFSVFWIPDMSLFIIITLSVLSLIFIFILVSTLRKGGIAVELTENKLLLHKKELDEIPLEDIVKISVHDGDGSFDIHVKTQTKKYSMHCFIKEQRKKKAELIALLREKGVRVDTFDF